MAGPARAARYSRLIGGDERSVAMRGQHAAPIQKSSTHWRAIFCFSGGCDRDGRDFSIHFGVGGFNKLGCRC